MPATDLPDGEVAAVIAAPRKLIAENKFPFAPRLKPLKWALAKLDPHPRSHHHHCRSPAPPNRLSAVA
jgi:hypothetical protein